MKRLYAMAACSLFSLGAQAADFDPTLEFECRLEDGRKVLVNDVFSGGSGKAMISDRSGTFYARASAGHGAQEMLIGISKGLRAWTNDLNLYVDLSGIDVHEGPRSKVAALHFMMEPRRLGANIPSCNP